MYGAMAYLVTRTSLDNSKVTSDHARRQTAGRGRLTSDVVDDDVGPPPGH